ncbi:hypothetical protein DU53_06035 [Kosmotoga sp. DU53]|nr:hypothetical protein DU53_06035 [Kosmotoga sp. DU53]
MEIKDIILQFLTENEEGMRNLLTWFLNTVMEYEARIQAGADYYERTKNRRAHRNGYKKKKFEHQIRKIGVEETPIQRIPLRNQGL